MNSSSPRLLARAGLVLAATAMLAAVPAAWSRGGRRHAEVSGVIKHVADPTAPTTLTLDTGSGEVTLQVDVNTEIEVDDADEADRNGTSSVRHGGGGGNDDNNNNNDDNDNDDNGGHHGHHGGDNDDDGECDDEEDDEAQFRGDLTTLIGHFAQVEFTASTGVAQEIHVERDVETFGRVTSAADGKVVIASFRGPSITVAVDANTLLEVDGTTPATLSDLEGLWVRVEYDPETFVATEIVAETSDRLLRGKIASVDPAGLLAVRTDQGVRNFTVTPDTDINLDFQDALLDALVAGMDAQVQFHFSGGAAVADRIDAVTPKTDEVNGTVTSVNVKSQTLQVTVKRGGRIVKKQLLKVNAGTTLVVNGRRARLAAVRKGANVNARFVPRRGPGIARSVSAHR